MRRATRLLTRPRLFSCLFTLVLLAALSLNGTVRPAYAATRTWTGAGGDNDWFNCANWNGGCPTAGDDVFFNNLFPSSYQSVVIAQPVTVASITVDASYTGTISCGAPVTVTGATTRPQNTSSPS